MKLILFKKAVNIRGFKMASKMAASAIFFSFHVGAKLAKKRPGYDDAIYLLSPLTSL